MRARWEKLMQIENLIIYSLLPRFAALNFLQKPSAVARKDKQVFKTDNGFFEWSKAKGAIEGFFSSFEQLITLKKSESQYYFQTMIHVDPHLASNCEDNKLACDPTWTWKFRKVRKWWWHTNSAVSATISCPSISRCVVSRKTTSLCIVISRQA